MNPEILLVDDNPGILRLTGRMLSDVAKIRFATSGEAALAVMREAAPDLVLLDAEMPGMSGFEVFDAMKTEPPLHDIPVIFVTSHSEPLMEVLGLNAGAADFISKPVNERILLARVNAQLRARSLADRRRSPATDNLFDLALKRRPQDLPSQIEWREEYGADTSVSLLLVEMDHLEEFNAAYGHAAGDASLSEIAQLVSGVDTRSCVPTGRDPGEPFVLLLPSTGRAEACASARLILHSVAALGIPHKSSPVGFHVTVSIGVAVCDPDSPNWVKAALDGAATPANWSICSKETMVEAAVNALRAAQHAGRAQAWLLDNAYFSESERASAIHASA